MTARYLTDGRPQALAHRGDRAGHPPGNRASAFASAIAMGFDHIESDVHVTSDGVAVLFHDDRLDDVTTGSGEIVDHRWTELAAIRYQHDGEVLDEGPMRLDEALRTWPDVYWNLDAKHEEAADTLMEVVRAADAVDRVLVTSFSRRVVRHLREANPTVATGMARAEIAAARLASWLRLPVPGRADAAQVPRSHRRIPVADHRFVEACHRAAVAVHVWTVDDPAEMHRLYDLGVDGIITNDPAALREVLRQRDRW